MFDAELVDSMNHSLVDVLQTGLKSQVIRTNVYDARSFEALLHLMFYKVPENCCLPGCTRAILRFSDVCRSVPGLALVSVNGQV